MASNLTAAKGNVELETEIKLIEVNRCSRSIVIEMPDGMRHKVVKGGKLIVRLGWNIKHN